MRSWAGGAAHAGPSHLRPSVRVAPTKSVRVTVSCRPVAPHLRGSASAPASVLRRKAFRAAVSAAHLKCCIAQRAPPPVIGATPLSPQMSMPEQEHPPSLSCTATTLKAVPEAVPDQRVVDLLTELGLEKYIEVQTHTEVT